MSSVQPARSAGTSVCVPLTERSRRAVGVDAEEEGGAGPVRDPRPRDVAHRDPRGAGSRHDDVDTGTLEQGAQPQRDLQVEDGLPQPRHHACGAAAVLDLARARPWADRLRLEVRLLVVAGIDDHDGAAAEGRAGSDQQHAGRDRDGSEDGTRHRLIVANRSA